MIWWFFQKQPKVGLVLGGGVARGIAHIGVLKVLKEYKVPIDFIVGSSSGSIVAAVYAAGLEISLIEQIAKRIHWRELMRLTFFKPGFIPAEAIADFFDKYIGGKSFNELPLPFAAVATDVLTGEKVVISEGQVARAIAASASFPGFFAPLEINGRVLVDGGISSNVPVDVAREMGAEYVIASDVVPSKYIHSLPSDPWTSLGHSLDMMLKRMSREECQRADVVIELQMEDEDIWHLDLHKAEKLIQAGEIAAHRAIHQIKKALKLRSGS